MNKKFEFTLKHIIDIIGQIGVLGVIGSLGIALTFWVQHWWVDMPNVFKILWVIGFANIYILSVEKNWSIFKRVPISGGGRT